MPSRRPGSPKFNKTLAHRALTLGSGAGSSTRSNATNAAALAAMPRSSPFCSRSRSWCSSAGSSDQRCLLIRPFAAGSSVRRWAYAMMQATFGLHGHPRPVCTWWAFLLVNDSIVLVDRIDYRDPGGGGRPFEGRGGASLPAPTSGPFRCPPSATGIGLLRLDHRERHSVRLAWQVALCFGLALGTLLTSPLGLTFGALPLIFDISPEPHRAHASKGVARHEVSGSSCCTLPMQIAGGHRLPVPAAFLCQAAARRGSPGGWT